MLHNFVDLHKSFDILHRYVITSYNLEAFNFMLTFGRIKSTQIIKVWDDKYLTNADFAFIYPFFVTSEICSLESKFLELLNFNMTVSSGLYAKYYFELRNLSKTDVSELFRNFVSKL